MTRPKVDPAKRQRTAQACDSCKKRKQKCDGQTPCTTCQKRKFDCTYFTIDHDPHYASSPGDHSTPKRARQSADSSPYGSHNKGTSLGNYQSGPSPELRYSDASLVDNAAKPSTYFPQTQSQDTNMPEAKSAQDESTDGDEEADIHNMTRMLEDGTGRLLYVGDASTISFLQLLRMIVETAAGPSSFTLDPGRHRIVENQLNMSLEKKLTYRLPDKETTLILVESFFVNSQGMLEIFNEKTFLGQVDRCYARPLFMDRSWLCLFFLVIAIGLSLATPLPGTREAAIIRDIRTHEADQSEIFYFNAKSLNDPTVGLEDSDFWSIQALTLMGVYMLARSMRNKAFAYVGMAIRSGYSLGLHREETLVVFSPEMQAARRMVWRSLFILDRFLAASLGRPIAITEDESLGDILDASTPVSISMTNTSQLTPNQLCAAGTAAAVRSGYVVGIILKKVYQQRKISTRLAQQLADECIQWPQSLSPALHWRQASPKNIRQAIAILHTNLVYCHSIILLTRPFFLFLLSAEIQSTRLGLSNSDEQGDWDQQRKQRSGRVYKFSKACLVASNHTVALVHNAYEGGYLPQLNPFSTYSLFAAALIVFANEFFWPSCNVLSSQSMANAITIFDYSGQMDPQAKRCALILREFRDVLTTQSSAVTTANSLIQAPFAPKTSSFGQQQPPEGDSGAQTPGSALPPLPSAILPATTSDTTAVVSPEMSSSNMAPPPALSTDDECYFSGLLDLENTVLPAGGDSYSADEAIDFDALWQGPIGQTLLPTPGGGGMMVLSG